MKERSLNIVLLVSLLVMGYFFLRQCKETEYRSDLLEWKNDTIKTYQDEQGRWLAEKSALQTSHKIAKDQLEKELDQVKKDLKIKSRNINSITYLNTSTESEIKIAKGGTLTFKDQFSTFSLTDTGAYYGLQYQIRDSLLIAGHWEREGWLKPKKLRVKSISYNPNTIITGLDQITITGKPSRFSVSIQAGYGLTNSGLSPYLGVGISYVLIRF